MSETTVETEALDEEFSGSYTTESEAPRIGQGSSLTAPGQALGRRKEAVARVRLIPGSGEWKINGRTLNEYFPNKLHQQLVRSPFTILDLEGVSTSSLESMAVACPARPELFAWASLALSTKSIVRPTVRPSRRQDSSLAMLDPSSARRLVSRRLARPRSSPSVDPLQPLRRSKPCGECTRWLGE